MPYPIATKQHADSRKLDDKQRSLVLSVPGFDRTGGSSVTAGCFLGAVNADTMPRLGFTVSTSSAIADGTLVPLRHPLASSRKRPHPGVEVHQAAAVSTNGVLSTKQHELRKLKARERQNSSSIRESLRGVSGHEEGVAASDFKADKRSQQEECRGEGGDRGGGGGPPQSPTAYSQSPMPSRMENSSFQRSSDEEDDGGSQTRSSRPTTPSLTPETGVLACPSGTTLVQQGEANGEFTSASGSSNAKNCRRRKKNIGGASNNIIAISGSESPSRFRLAMSQLPPHLIDPSFNNGTAAVEGGDSRTGDRHVEEKGALSRRRDGHVTAYADTGSPSTKKKGAAKRARGRGGRGAGVGVSVTREAGAAAAAERIKELEAVMDVAMTSPVTYEEQVRRERLAHLRVMYTVSERSEAYNRT